MSGFEAGALTFGIVLLGGAVGFILCMIVFGLFKRMRGDTPRISWHLPSNWPDSSSDLPEDSSVDSSD